MRTPTPIPSVPPARRRKSDTRNASRICDAANQEAMEYADVISTGARATRQTSCWFNKQRSHVWLVLIIFRSRRWFADLLNRASRMAKSDAGEHLTLNIHAHVTQKRCVALLFQALLFEIAKIGRVADSRPLSPRHPGRTSRSTSFATCSTRTARPSTHTRLSLVCAHHRTSVGRTLSASCPSSMKT